MVISRFFVFYGYRVFLMDIPAGFDTAAAATRAWAAYAASNPGAQYLAPHIRQIDVCVAAKGDRP